MYKPSYGLKVGNLDIPIHCVQPEFSSPLYSSNVLSICSLDVEVSCSKVAPEFLVSFTRLNV